MIMWYIFLFSSFPMVSKTEYNFVYFPRRNICAKMNKPCSTLGLSQVNGLCQPHRTCNINEDTGLSLAYTVAHELGHK